MITQNLSLLPESVLICSIFSTICMHIIFPLMIDSFPCEGLLYVFPSSFVIQISCTSHTLKERPHHSRPLWSEVRGESESKLFTVHLSQIWSQAIIMFVLVLWGLIKSNRCTQDIKKEDLKICGYPLMPYSTLWRHATFFLSHEYTFAYSTASLLFPVDSNSHSGPQKYRDTIYIFIIRYIWYYKSSSALFVFLSDLTLVWCVSVWYSVIVCRSTHKNIL